MPMRMTNTMWERWRTHHHVAQSEEAADADYRPNVRVFVTRGHMTRHNDEYGQNWRGDWDEHWVYGRNDTQPMYADSPIGGVARAADWREPVEIPHISNVTINANTSQGGIATASISLENVYEEEETGLEGFVYHTLRGGFFSPFYNGDPTENDIMDDDLFTDTAVDRAIYARNEEGKIITGLLLPNRRVEVYAGYGDEIQLVFIGLIDQVNVSSNPATIELDCSDFGRTLADTTYQTFTVPRGAYPVQFGDYEHWRGHGRKNLPKFGALSTMTYVEDITAIPGRILAWAGFHYWRRVRAGRIGQANVAKLEGNTAHDALFDGDNFEKGAFFLDGINQIKELLGYTFFIAPYINPGLDASISGRNTDPTVYDGRHSKYMVGVPHFVPPNIWDNQDVADVETFHEDDILLDAALQYDYTPLRKRFYYVGAPIKRRGKARTQTIGYKPPHFLDVGLWSDIWFNGKTEFQNLKLSELEVGMLQRMTMIQTLMHYNKGQFTIPGYPGILINDQIGIQESVSGTYRVFYVLGYTHDISIGPNGTTFQTTVETVNIDNIYIRRIKAEMAKLMGIKEDGIYYLAPSRVAQMASTPAGMNQWGTGDS